MNSKKIAAQLAAAAKLIIADSITKYYTLVNSELQLSYEFAAKGQIMTKQDVLVTFRVLGQMNDAEQIKINQIMRQTLAQKREEEQVEFHSSTIALVVFSDIGDMDRYRLVNILNRLGFKNI